MLFIPLKCNRKEMKLYNRLFTQAKSAKRLGTKVKTTTTVIKGNLKES
jgi:hypothetical protein